MNKIIYIFISLFFVQQAGGQTLSDALRLARLNPGGTARTVGAGSALGALGGDFSGVNINPAGIADYRISEFTFTPSVNVTNVDSYLTGDRNTISSDESKLSIDNIGFVSVSRPTGSSIYNLNLAIGFSRMADFNTTFEYSGKTLGSITERFAERANGKSFDLLDDFEAYPAYSQDAIFDLNDDNQYETDFNPENRVLKQQIVNQTGYLSELTFALAANVRDKVNFGLSIGVPFLSFEERKSYIESDPDDEIQYFNNLEYIEFLKTTGAGINFKTGITYKGIKNLRVGAAIHSPTWYVVDDEYNTSFAYSYTLEPDDAPSLSPDGSFRYRINSPWRAVGSIAGIGRIGEIKGFISADVEFLDYANGSFNLGAYSSDIEDDLFSDELNREIDQELGTALNFRIGGELAYNALRLRAGVGFNGSPYAVDDNEYNEMYSAGIGFRQDRFFIDMAYRMTNYSEGYSPYFLVDDVDERTPLVVNDVDTHKFVVTVGFKL